MSLTFVKASCKCGLNTFQIPFATSKLPLNSKLCHCNTCRHTTGQLAMQYAAIEGAPLSADSGPASQKPADLSNLKTYSATEVITRYFCSTCCACLLFEAKVESVSHWGVSTGALERIEGIVKVGHHVFVSDTLDGGLADHYRVVDGVNLPRYSLQEGTAILPVGWKADKIVKEGQPKPVAAGGQEHIAAYCHCRTISLHLTRVDEEATKNPQNWWAIAKKEDDPTSRTRFISGHCLCTSCRLSSGSTISSWIILPRANILDAHTSRPVSFANGSSGRPQGLKQYESSPGTYRESCDTCGATVFYWTTAKRAHLPTPADGEALVVDVGAGLIDQEDGGARAEGWSHWYENIIHPEDAVDKVGLKVLAEGIKPATKSI